MKKYITIKMLLCAIIIIPVFYLISCKKDTANPATSPPKNKSCKLVFWKATEFANPYYFKYTSQEKISKSRVFTNGTYNPPTVTVFEYNTQHQLVKTYDSVNVALNNEYTSTIAYSDFNMAGYPLKAVHKLVKSGRRFSEVDFVYNTKNNVIRAIIAIFDSNDKLYTKDTANFYYDSNENFIKGTANTKLNGVRKEYTAIEAEGYDTKPCFYKSLGIEFQLQRIAGSGDAYQAAGYYGYYFYSPTSNNFGKIYLHNQGLDNKGDYLTYTYQYDSITGYPTNISFTNTQLGVTRGTTIAEAKYDCDESN